MIFTEHFPTCQRPRQIRCGTVPGRRPGSAGRFPHAHHRACAGALAHRRHDAALGGAGCAGTSGACGCHPQDLRAGLRRGRFRHAGNAARQGNDGQGAAPMRGWPGTLIHALLCYAEGGGNLLTNPALDPSARSGIQIALRGRGRQGRWKPAVRHPLPWEEAKWVYLQRALTTFAVQLISRLETGGFGLQWDCARQSPPGTRLHDDLADSPRSGAENQAGSQSQRGRLSHQAGKAATPSGPCAARLCRQLAAVTPFWCRWLGTAMPAPAQEGAGRFRCSSRCPGWPKVPATPTSRSPKRCPQD